MGELVYKNQLLDAEKVVDHIRAQGGAWVPITIKDIQSVTGVNPSYASGIYRSLQHHEKLQCRKGTVGPRGGRKILEFREAGIGQMPIPVAPENPDEIHHIHRDLTLGQVYRYQVIMSKKKISNENMEILLTILNFLYGRGAHLAPLKEYSKLIMSVFMMKSVRFQTYIGQLKAWRLVAHSPQGITIIPLDAPAQEDKQDDPEPPPIEDSLSDAETPSEPSQSPSEDQNVPPIESEPSPIDTTQSDLVDGLRGFSSLIEEFKSFIDERIPDTKNPELQRLIDENEAIRTSHDTLYKTYAETKKDLEKGQDALDKLLAENQQIKQQLEEQKAETKKYKDYYGSEHQMNQNVFDALQESMQILIADINGTIVDFTRIPAFKIKPADHARVQQQVIQAITTAVDRVNQANKTGSGYISEK